MSPDGSGKPPPEEKLLQLIRGKGPKRPAPTPSSTQAVQAAAASAGSVAVVIGRPRGGFSFPWTRVAIGALSVALGIEGIALIVEALWPMPLVETPSIRAQSSHGTGAGTTTAMGLDEMPSLAASASRPIFAVSAAASSSTGTDQVTRAAPSATAQLLAVRLTLMGIVAGNPAQAIIQDSQTQKTYFVKVGQPVIEGAILEKVLEHRAVLNLNGEQIELAL